MKSVLVTGATGFVGRPLVAALKGQVEAVHVLARGDADFPGSTVHACDLHDAVGVRALVASLKPSHLIHLAWYAEPGVYWRSPENLAWVAASLNLVRAFAEAGGIRAVAAGTCAEYAWGSERLNEADTPREPATLYGAAKDATFRVLDAYASVAGLSLAWGRLFFLYGPGERAGRLVADATRSILDGKPFESSHGLQRRDFLHVEDVAGALLALCRSEVTGAVNIGSGTAPTVRSILERIASCAGRPDLLRLGARPLAPTEPADIVADSRRLATEVGFVPRHDLDSGVAQTVAWWRSRTAA